MYNKTTTLLSYQDQLHSYHYILLLVNPKKNHGKTCEERLSGRAIERGYHVLYNLNFVYLEPASINPVGKTLDRYGQSLLLRRER